VPTRSTSVTAKDKIQKLTNAWYGFAFFVGIANLLINGIGFFSISAAAVSTFISFVWTFVLGRLLLKKSSLTRTVLVVLSAISVVLGVLGAGSLVMKGELVMSGLMALSVYMNGRSFRVLTDKSVKAYFA